MSVESIPEDQFVREFTKELHSRNAAAFIGAGFYCRHADFTLATWVTEYVVVSAGLRGRFSGVTYALL